MTLYLKVGALGWGAQQGLWGQGKGIWGKGGVVSLDIVLGQAVIFQDGFPKFKNKLQDVG